MNASWFENLWDARGKISAWRQEYNQVRPHSSLGYRTPEEFEREVAANGCGKAAAWGSLAPPRSKKNQPRKSYPEVDGKRGQVTTNNTSPICLLVSSFLLEFRDYSRLAAL